MSPKTRPCSRLPASYTPSADVPNAATNIRSMRQISPSFCPGTPCGTTGRTSSRSADSPCPASCTAPSAGPGSVIPKKRRSSPTVWTACMRWRSRTPRPMRPGPASETSWQSSSPTGRTCGSSPFAGWVFIWESLSIFWTPMTILKTMRNRGVSIPFCPFAPGCRKAARTSTPTCALC